MEYKVRPCYAEVNLTNIKHNLNEVRSIVKNKKIIGVVKANAYGHGDIEVSRALISSGVDILAVATVEEALKLRNYYDVKILVLGPVSEYQIKDCIINRISFIASDENYIKIVESISNQLGISSSVHFAVDTGMGRVGFPLNTYNLNEALDLIKLIINSKNICLEGIFTHFASSDDDDLSFMYKQYNLFLNLINKALEFKSDIEYIHCQNSGGILNLDDSVCNAVRPGIILYGYKPSLVSKHIIDLKPALSWKTKVSFIKRVLKDTPIGYGSAYKATENCTILTLPLGYADGLRRDLFTKGVVSIKNRLFPIVGKICMDQAMVCVPNNFECSVGDTVELINSTELTANDMADKLNTIAYEILCGISDRVPRVYIDK